MCAIYVELLCVVRFGLGRTHDAFYIAYYMLMHFHAYVPILYLSFDTKMFGAFLCVCVFVCVCVCVCVSLSLSFLH